MQGKIEDKEQQKVIQKLYDVIFLYENEELKKQNQFQFQLSQENIQKMVAGQSQSHVLVVLIAKSILYSIGELKIQDKNKVSFVNGVIFNFTLTKIISKCQNKKVVKYLERINEKDYKFTIDQKIQFVQKAISIKYFPELQLKSIPIPFIYKNDQSSIIQIQSPIIEMIPQLINLEQAHPFKQQNANLSKNPNIYKRVLREIMEVNQDFHSLRTVITPDIEGRMNIFNFVMYPNDGAFCSLPLIGRLIINQNYPKNPPVFHLFTRTSRYNLDVFNNMARNNSMDGSSICFDLVKPITNPQSAWKPQFTISTVFASIMSAIVSYKVTQMHGGQIQQSVTMEKLKDSFNNVKQQITTRWKQLTRLPMIPTIKSARIMCQKIKFPILQKYQSYRFVKGQQKVISEPINVQQDYWTTEFVLKQLSPQYVLSFILTNDVMDLQGKKLNTILFRNGVTATAAKKLKNKNISWFYHGRPLNNGQMYLNITITPHQFIFSYKNQSTKWNWVVHGDTPITSLQQKIVGNLKKQSFNLVIYVKNKNMKLNGKFNIKQIFTNIGYIHKNSQPQSN